MAKNKVHIEGCKKLTIGYKQILILSKPNKFIWYNKRQIVNKIRMSEHEM